MIFPAIIVRSTNRWAQGAEELARAVFGDKWFTCPGPLEKTEMGMGLWSSCPASEAKLTSIDNRQLAASFARCPAA